MSFRAELLFPLIIFSIATLFTPGPNNVMLMTAALNFGLRRALGAILGVAFGFGFLVLCVGAWRYGRSYLPAYPIMPIVVRKYAGETSMAALCLPCGRIATVNLRLPIRRRRTQGAVSANVAKANFFVGFGRHFQWINPSILGLG